MKTFRNRLAAPIFAALACSFPGLFPFAQAETFDLVEFQTVDFNNLFPANGSNNIDVFDSTGTTSATAAPFDTTAYVRSSVNSNAAFVPRRAQLYLQFDLSGLGQDTIARATLDFSAYSLNDLTAAVNSPELFVSQLAGDWSPSGDEGTLNPVFDPVLYETVSGGGVTSGTGTDLYTGGGFTPGTFRNTTVYSVDVTNIVRNWQDGDPNHGLHLELGDSVSFNQGIGIDPSSLKLNVIAADTPVPTLSTDFSSVTTDYTVYVDFSEDVSGLESDDFTVINGSASTLVGSGANYTLTISPTTAGNVEITLPADAVNATVGGSGNVVSNTLITLYDPPAPPSVTLSTPAGLFDQFTVNVVFDEAVAGLEDADFVVTNGYASDLMGTGATYSIKITADSTGSIEVTLPADSVTDLDDGLGNLESNTLAVVNNPADSALTNFINGNLNNPVPAIPGTTSGNTPYYLDPTTNIVQSEVGGDSVRANQWVLPTASSGFVFGADSGSAGMGDGAMIGSGSYNARPRAVFYFADDNKESTGLLDFGMDVFLDDNSPENDLKFLVEIYAWNDEEIEPRLSWGGPTANVATYNLTDLGEAVTLLNRQVLASSAADASWQTLALGSADVGAGYDNYVWRIGVMGATNGDVFAFDNVTVSVGTPAPEITSISRAPTGVVSIEFTSSAGNVDVYRSTDLLDFGDSPIDSDVPPGSYIDGTAISLPKAFYILVPTGDPAP
ncbi:Ig-like domain-containing protein [Haloferula chungangensis]|uniref:Ig-like domain-containing protein n=1 Tax=Haloferula chungangensis TaxID=1048331 RepID=A0ABW2L8S2_9BACT